jgi:cytochrome c oxidase subunit 3
MRVFLASLGVLFATSVIGYVAIRVLAVDAPLDLPQLPGGLWFSTLFLIGSSFSIQHAVTAARHGRPGALRTGLTVTAALGVGFLIVQVICWAAWSGPMQASLAQSEQRFMLTGFYVLTGLHAVHVIGGLVPLAVLTARAWIAPVTATDRPGVIYTAMYWHFLDGVWLVLFLTLLIGS